MTLLEQQQLLSLRRRCVCHVIDRCKKKRYANNDRSLSLTLCLVPDRGYVRKT